MCFRRQSRDSRTYSRLHIFSRSQLPWLWLLLMLICELFPFFLVFSHSQKGQQKTVRAFIQHDNPKELLNKVETRKEVLCWLLVFRNAKFHFFCRQEKKWNNEAEKLKMECCIWDMLILNNFAVFNYFINYYPCIFYDLTICYFFWKENAVFDYAT